jgi:uncharacterized membrane protein YkgB
MTEAPLTGRLRETPRTIVDRAGTLLTLRLSLAVIFVWFGASKPLGPSPAVPLVSNAVSTLDTFWVFVPYDLFFPVLGWWEAFVGLCLLSRRTTVLAVLMMVPRILSTIFVMLLIPGMTFAAFPFVPSMAGMYIVKNLVLLSSSLVVASTVTERTGSVSTSTERADLPDRLERAERAVVRCVDRYSLLSLRYALAAVFVWSGAWTLLGINEAEHLVAGLLDVISPETFALVFGWWKVTIGCCLCYRPTVRVATALTIPHIAVAVLSLVLVPAATFTYFPLASSFEEVYIIKDWVLLSGVLVVTAIPPDD